MKDRYSNVKENKEIPLYIPLEELREKALKENDGKVHIREVDDNGHIGNTIETY